MNKLIILIAAALQLSFQTYSQINIDNDEKILAAVSTQSSSGLEQWKNLKFGMFIHWGVYSIPAGIWKGKKIEKLG